VTTYDAVLFDNDGVLVEPPARETQSGATRAAFRAVGIDDPADDHVEALVSGVTADRLRGIAGAYGLDPRRLWAARERHDEHSQFAAFERGDRTAYDDAAAVPAVAGDRPLGVVSNNHHSTVAYVLDRFGMDGWFDTYYGREKTVESLGLKKPATHYLDRALSDLGADPGATLYVGDSGSDVVAADRAGTDSAFVRRPGADADPPTTPTFEVTDLHGLSGILGE
jgi:HAD superfamily hydrolase (TIGR01549 family)